MEMAIVLKNIASVKLLPDSSSEQSDEVLHGMVLEIIHKNNDPWYKIKTAYDYEGYVHKDDLVPGSSETSIWQKECHVIWSMTADVMSEAKYGSVVLSTLARGSLIRTTGVYQSKWEKIGLADGGQGWIRVGFARPIERLSLVADEELLRDRIVSTALDYIGTQYRWGGKTALGIDCSGLSSMAYMLNGISLPRDTAPQQKYLKPIKREEAKPGDLLFFPGHTAVYIGKGRYVHATGREGYTLINSFNKGCEDYREDLDMLQTGIGTIFGM